MGGGWPSTGVVAEDDLVPFLSLHSNMKGFIYEH